MAPKFNLVSSPNEWTKRQPPNPIEVTEIKLIQQEFWQGLRKRLSESNSIVKAQAPRPQNWANFSLGKSNFHLLANVNTLDCFIMVQLVCGGPEAKPHFYLLQQDSEIIEKEIGCKLDWRELPEKNKSYISIRLDDADVTERKDWDYHYEWVIEKLEIFHKVFAQRVKDLDADDYILEDDDQ